MGLLDGFLRGTGVGESKPPSAGFLFEETIAAHKGIRFTQNNAEGRIFLGVVGGKAEEHRRADGSLEQRYITGGTPIGIQDDRHIITVAGSRAGKSRAAILPNLLKYPGSMLVIDPKGDLARDTAVHRQKVLNQRVVVLDPFGVSGMKMEPSVSFNPMTILKPDSPTFLEDAGLIADALVVEDNPTDSHWNDSAKQFIETLVLHVATAPQYENSRDLITVLSLTHRILKPSKDAPRTKDDQKSFALDEELTDNQALDGAIAAGARNIYDRERRELSSVISTVRRHTHFLNYKQIQNVLRRKVLALEATLGQIKERRGEVPTGMQLDLADLKRKPTTIYLSLPAMRMGTCSRWLRLIVNMVLSQMEAVREKPVHPVLLCLDEFAVLGRMKTIEDAAGQIAGLGVRLWPILQDIGQLKSLYSQRWETFMGNAGVLQFFGNSDLTTLEWISKRLGETTVISRSKANLPFDQRNVQGAQGESFNQSVHPLMTPEEVSRLFGRDDDQLRQLIIRPSFPPMVLQRAFYDKWDWFRGLVPGA